MPQPLVPRSFKGTSIRTTLAPAIHAAPVAAGPTPPEALSSSGQHDSFSNCQFAQFSEHLSHCFRWVLAWFSPEARHRITNACGSALFGRIISLRKVPLLGCLMINGGTSGLWDIPWHQYNLRSQARAIKCTTRFAVWGDERIPRKMRGEPQ